MAAMAMVQEKNPADELCAELAATAPRVPFYTQQYRDAVRATGCEVWLLGHERDGRLIYGCLGEISKGRVNSELRLHSAPDAADDAFWQDVLRFCREQRLTQLNIGTACTFPTYPPLGRPLASFERHEFWLDLTPADIKARMKPEPRRTYRKAGENGMTLIVPSIDDGLRSLRELVHESLERRRDRGESIPQYSETDLPYALVKHGAARLYQCVQDGRVLGTLMIAVAARGAYSYSSGYIYDGKRTGAGVFLNMAAAQALKDEGMELYNLGAAPLDSGLATFKMSIGGVPRASRATRYFVGSTARYGLAKVLGYSSAAVQEIRSRFGSAAS